MMCAGITKVCGYSLDLATFYRRMSQGLVLFKIARASDGTTLGDRLQKIYYDHCYYPDYHVSPMEKAARVCEENDTSIAALLVKAEKRAGIVGLGVGFGSFLHLPAYPWDVRLISKSDAAGEIGCLLHNLCNESFRRLQAEEILSRLVFIDDAEDISEVLNE